MPLIDRRFNYRDVIQVGPGALQAVRQGKKRCTVRLGTLGVDAEFLHLTDGAESVRVRIDKVDSGRVLSQLTPTDAYLDGVESLDDLMSALRHFYGDLEPDQPMTVIYFTATE